MESFSHWEILYSIEFSEISYLINYKSLVEHELEVFKTVNLQTICLHSVLIWSSNFNIYLATNNKPFSWSGKLKHIR